MEFSLQSFPPSAKNLVRSFILVLAIGVSCGLVLVGVTTRTSMEGMQERFLGSTIEVEGEIPEAYPKPIMEMLITTHGHVTSFCLIFLALGGLFQGVQCSKFWKQFWTVEPFLSILTTFGGIWLMRYIHPGFHWLVLISSILLYTSFYWMAFSIVRETYRS